MLSPETVEKRIKFPTKIM